MCGINAIISKEAYLGSDKIIKLMTDTIAHRGPDGQGFFNHNRISLGHRRLSIIDLSDSASQPMHYMNRYVIVFNGEIFNYVEIRDELLRNGYQFISESDTEVIMAAYDYWGVSCLEKFNGMWAFVLYDLLRDRVLISRDRFGIKPLYYYKDNNYYVFSSEIKAILNHPKVVAQPNTEYCQLFAEIGSKEWIADTAYSNIFRFLQASYIDMSISDLFSQGFNYIKYWHKTPNLSNEKFNKSNAESYADEYYNILKDSVKLRLRSDVKVGSALSGGIDSSTIVKLVNENLSEGTGSYHNQFTFSSVYNSSNNVKYCDESIFINKLSKYLEVKSFKIEPRLEDVIETHKKISYHMDTPYEGTLISPWYVYKLASENGVKVTLDGQGADEQLGGYSSYAKLSISESRNPFKTYWSFSDMPNIKSSLRQGLIIGLMRRTVPDKILQIIFEKYRFNPIYLKSLNEKLYMDTLESLTHHLHFGDRLSMAHSIESRVPFMDYRFVEFALNLPASYKIHNGWTKYIARLAMNGKLPEDILWRRDKLGFPAPEKYWFNGPLKQWIDDEINSSGFLKELGLDYLISDQSLSLNKKIRLLNLATWHRTFISK